MLFRTEAQKRDLEWSWKRGDRAFFAAGACHILAHVFLERHPWMFLPSAGFRGGHIFAANERVAFDYHGFSDREAYETHYWRKIRHFFPGWQGKLIRLDDFMTPSFFSEFNHRAPDQYFMNPLPRTAAFIDRMKKWAIQREVDTGLR